MAAYLVDLALRLADGIERLPDDVIDRHTHFILQHQNADGGWGGREGPSDTYYTSFALRSLALVAQLDGPVAERAISFIDQQLERVDSTSDRTFASTVDFISAVFSAAQLEAATGVDLLTNRDQPWRECVQATWTELARGDGGYAKTPQSGSGSTYHTFLIVLASQLLERPLPDAGRIVPFITSRHRDGGFVEIAAMRRAGTNPTAAALALLKIYDALPDDLRHTGTNFLSEMQSTEGGLTANTRIPVADLLSTFTGLLTLTDLITESELSKTIDLPAIHRYVTVLEQPSGGFIGGVWDSDPDIEYTFYGLATLALLT